MKIRKMIVFIVLALILTGCTPLDEVSNKIYIDSMAVDSENGVYKVYLRPFGSVSEEDESNEEEKDSNIIYSEGKTIEDAINNAMLKEGKKIFLGHCNVIALSGSVSDFFDTTECFIEANTVPLSCKLVYTTNVRTFIEAENNDNLVKILNRNKEAGKSTENSMFSFYETFASKEGFIAPNINSMDSNVSVNGGAIVKNGMPYKLVDEKTIEGICVLNNTVDCMTVALSDERGTATVKLDNIKTCKKAYIREENAVLDLSVKFRCTVTDNPDNLTEKEIEELSRGYINDVINHAVIEATETKTDLINIKKIFKKQQPDFYYNHQDEPLFDYITFNADISTCIDKQTKI